MKTIQTISTLLAAAALLLAPRAFAQNVTPSTTLNAALTASAQNSTVCLASTANILYSQGNFGGLYVDLEYMLVTSAPSNGCVTVIRGQQGTAPQAHAKSQTVWIDQFQIVGLDSGFRYGNTLQPSYGPCTATGYQTLPLVNVGISDPFAIETCTPAAAVNVEFSGGQWVPYTFERTVMIGPGNCAWSTTGTYAAQVAVATGGPNTQGLTVTGASLIPTNQISVTAAGASASTLTCYLSSDSFQPLLNKGATITSYDVIYGVQTTTLTSINGAAVSTITLPTPAASEIASAVTPVAIAGSLTTTSTTGNMATVTAGAFRSLRVNLATPLNLSTDLNAVLFQLVFNQSASAAEILNTPGILIHYTYLER